MVLTRSSPWQIGDLRFFRSPAYQEFFRALDDSGGFYHERVRCKCPATARRAVPSGPELMVRDALLTVGRCSRPLTCARRSRRHGTSPLVCQLALLPLSVLLLTPSPPRQLRGLCLPARLVLPLPRSKHAFDRSTERGPRWKGGRRVRLPVPEGRRAARTGQGAGAGRHGCVCALSRLSAPMLRSARC